MRTLDGATFLLQWASGGLAFVWVTTRRRAVGLGYGWLLRGIYLTFALLSMLIGALLIDGVIGRELASLGVVAASGFALATSMKRRDVGVAGFDPRLDLAAPIIGAVGIVATGVAHGDPPALAVARLVVGALFLGVVTDAMLLGHWYLVQPGLPRASILELVRWAGWLSVAEILLLLLPTGMVSAFKGTINDGYGGLLTWFWGACAASTIGLVIVTRLALRERQYAAVMAATGLLYLAILTAFGTDLVARALLSG